MHVRYWLFSRLFLNILNVFFLSRMVPDAMGLLAFILIQMASPCFGLMLLTSMSTNGWAIRVELKLKAMIISLKIMSLSYHLLCMLDNVDCFLQVKTSGTFVYNIFRDIIYEF